MRRSNWRELTRDEISDGRGRRASDTQTQSNHKKRNSDTRSPETDSPSVQVMQPHAFARTLPGQLPQGWSQAQRTNARQQQVQSQWQTTQLAVRSPFFDGTYASPSSAGVTLRVLAPAPVSGSVRAPFVSVEVNRGDSSLQLKPLLFSSASVPRIRALLRHGTSRATASLFTAPALALSDLFDVRQSSGISADLLQTGRRSIAFLFVTEKELEWEDKRLPFVQR